MAVGKTQEGKMSPVHFFSHGSTMMLGEDSASARYWERMGEEALKMGVEHVVMMVSSVDDPTPQNTVFPLRTQVTGAQITGSFNYHTILNVS